MLSGSQKYVMRDYTTGKYYTGSGWPVADPSKRVNFFDTSIERASKFNSKREVYLAMQALTPNRECVEYDLAVDIVEHAGWSVFRSDV
jgi:hypothetical protein